MNAGDVSGVSTSGGNGVIASGIYSRMGRVIVKDTARLSISLTGEGAMHAAGIMNGSRGFYFTTSKPVLIDLTHISVTGKVGVSNYPGYTAGLDVNNPDASTVSELTAIENCPALIIKADYVFHSPTGSTLTNPSVSGYTYNKIAGQYTNTHTYTRSGLKSVEDLTVSMTPPSDNRYWGGHVVPTVVVKNGSTTLEEMSDYVVLYDPNNINPGQIKVFIEGMGSYAGIRQVGTFTIAERFSDVNPSTDHYKDILWMYANGITTGFPNGTFKPYDTIKRCDMAAFLYRMAGSPDFTPSEAQKNAFNDVTSATDHAKEIWWLASKGISTGFPDGGFHPYDPVSRCDMAAFLYRLADIETFNPSSTLVESFSDVTLSTYHAKEIWWLAAEGVSTGFPDGTFRPYNYITRCDMAAFLHRMEEYGLV